MPPAAKRPLATDATGRPVRPALTREYIVRAALAILDRDGPAGLSMRKLGAELGVNPMAFYHHLPNKGALFDGVIEAAYAELDVDIDGPDGGWRNILAAFARGLYDVLRRHPHVVPLVATRPAYSPAVLGVADRALGALGRSGFADRDLLVMVNALRSFTIGHVLAETGDPAGGPVPAAADAAVLLGDYPNLARAITGGHRPQEQFEQVLAALLDGFDRWPRRAGT
ncbi:TetR/AcrR family transcriptional regulator [Dactylosporangium sp. NPDC051541]|uniref:TetR/AcrR family transcriptional regulator n=1 Tax=Dactylosporangium sp. NPDC051541 TaxID=3363977 RepID=UPI0037B7028C